MNDNKRIAINSVVIFARLCVVSLVSIIASRVVLDALGASDFGLYNVVGGIIMLLNVLNMAMSGATYRFIATEMGKGDHGNVNKIFNISFSIHFLFAVCILLLGLTIGEYYINHWLNVAPEKLDDARMVFHITMITTFFSTALVPCYGLLVAYEKFTVTALVEIASNLVRLVAVCTILYGSSNRLLCYSIIMMSASLMNWGAYFFYSLIKYRKLIAFKIYKDADTYKEMLSFSGWNAFGAFSNVAKTQATAMIINFFFGTLVNAAFAVANQINSFVIMFANCINTAAVPQITKSFSAGNKGRSLELTARISKYTFFMMVLVAFPVLMELDSLLSLWLKDVPEGANIYCVLIVIAGLLKCVCQGTGSLVQASGKIKIFQIVGSFLVLSSLPIGALCFYLGANAYALSAVICLINGINIPVNLILLRRIINFDIMMFYKVSYSRMLYVLIPLITVYFVYKLFLLYAMPLFVGLVISGLIVVCLIYFIGLDNKEKSLVHNLIKYRILKR